MPDLDRFFRQTRQFSAGVLTDFKENQRNPGEKDASRRRFVIFQTGPKGSVPSNGQPEIFSAQCREGRKQRIQRAHPQIQSRP